MRRVLATFQWQVDMWRQHAQRFSGGDKQHNSFETPKDRRESILNEGMASYAIRQASIRERMRTDCLVKWAGISENLGTMVDRDATQRVECH